MQRIKRGMPFPLGVSQTDEGVQFVLHAVHAKSCNLLLFESGEKEVKTRIDLKEYQIGNVYSICFEKKKQTDFEGMEYLYEVNGISQIDPYATKLTGRTDWGVMLEENMQRGVIYNPSFDWEGDTQLLINYSDLYVYELHVRGFTKHISSKVAHKGTFAGVKEKIPYIKKLGVNALLLLPCYDFEECIKEEELGMYEAKEEQKINYWGYAKSAYYFAPKASYAADKNHPQFEMKDMVKALHREKIEAIMDMYFPEGTDITLIIDCLRFWYLSYHIDGFRFNDNVVPIEMIAKDPILGAAKLLSTYWKEEDHQADTKEGGKRFVAEYNDGFLTDARRFLKSDEGQVRSFMHRFKKNPDNIAVINYLTSVNGFTLMDLVSYDIKHNEDNGEQGRDGTDYNYSWNCGKEGETKSKKVLNLRKKQIKNALLMLFFSQGTPMLLSGDEFGNSQNGNNNPYCQDNAITWLNWKNLEKHKELFLFVKELIAFRKAHPIFHVEKELTGMDYKRSGNPDISFHGTKAWYIDDSNYSRLLSVLLNGEYQTLSDGSKEDSFYIAFNMHWEAHTFDLPKLTRGKQWKLKWDTSKSKLEEEVLEDQRRYLVKPRSVVVLYGNGEVN